MNISIIYTYADKIFVFKKICKREQYLTGLDLLSTNYKFKFKKIVKEKKKDRKENMHKNQLCTSVQ